jgi:hypothetical protein
MSVIAVKTGLFPFVNPSEESLEAVELLLGRDDIDPNALDRNGVSVDSRDFMDSPRVSYKIESLLRAVGAR